MNRHGKLLRVHLGSFKVVDRSKHGGGLADIKGANRSQHDLCKDL